MPLRFFAREVLRPDPTVSMVAWDDRGHWLVLGGWGGAEVRRGPLAPAGAGRVWEGPLSSPGADPEDAGVVELACVSRDGARAAFFADCHTGGTGRPGLFLVDLRRGKTTELPWEETRSPLALRFSDDGRALRWVTATGLASANVKTRRLTHHETRWAGRLEVLDVFRLSADGTIVFSVAQGRATELWTSRSGRRRRLATVPGLVLGVSLDARTAYVQQRSRFRAVTLDTGRATQVSCTPPLDQHAVLALSPDASQLAARSPAGELLLFATTPPAQPVPLPARPKKTVRAASPPKQRAAPAPPRKKPARTTGEPGLARQLAAHDGPLDALLVRLEEASSDELELGLALARLAKSGARRHELAFYAGVILSSCEDFDDVGASARGVALLRAVASHFDSATCWLQLATVETEPGAAVRALERGLVADEPVGAPHDAFLRFARRRLNAALSFAGFALLHAARTQAPEARVALLDRLMSHRQLGGVDRAMALISRADVEEKLGRKAGAASSLEQALVLLDEADFPKIYGAAPALLRSRLVALKR